MDIQRKAEVIDAERREALVVFKIVAYGYAIIFAISGLLSTFG